MLGILIFGSFFGLLSAGLVLLSGNTLVMALLAYCLAGSSSTLVSLLVLYSKSVFFKQSLNQSLAPEGTSKS